jgi:hypothetical protein
MRKLELDTNDIHSLQTHAIYISDNKLASKKQLNPASDRDEHVTT